MIADDRANALAHDVRTGINYLKSCVDPDEFRQLKEYVEECDQISQEDKEKDKAMFEAIEILMKV